MNEIEVTDPDILARLNQGTEREVTDPALLQRLNEQPSFGQKLLRGAETGAGLINKIVEAARLPEAAGGILQGGEHVAASLANLPLSAINKLTGTHMEVPYVDLQRFGRQDPFSRAAFDIGKVGGEILGGGEVFGRAANVLRPTTLAREAALGAGTGFAVGGQPEDSMKNRLIAALVGGALSGTAALGSKAIARKTLARKEAMKKGFQKEYGDIFKDVKSAGLHDEPITTPGALDEIGVSPETETVYKNIPKAYRESVEQFKENPTFENAHSAQRELAKFGRQHQSSVESAARSPTGREIPGVKYDAAQLAKDLRESLQNSMENFLAKNNRLDLVNRYKAAGQRYAEEMVPFKNRAIARYEQGLTRPGKFVKELVSEEKFMKPKGQYKSIPGLGAKRVITESGAPELMKKAATGGAIGSGAWILYNAGMPYLANLLRRSQ